MRLHLLLRLRLCGLGLLLGGIYNFADLDFDSSLKEDVNPELAWSD